MTGIPDGALALIIEYYAFDAKKQTKQALIVYRAFAATGIRLMIQEVCGYRSQPEPIQLPPGDIRLDNVIKAFDRLGVDVQNPRLHQGFKDWAIDVVLGDRLAPAQEDLPGQTQQWRGVTERAEELGYGASVVTKHRSPLGKYVKANSGIVPTQEKRQCNGTQRNINLYPVSDRLDASIHSYFELKGILLFPVN
ncbi:MAG: hypothetical protein F6J98_02080 [Moorea sp. SIO4G2]|nr:hypothetical protein [Moorena sp. SIO4G2]